MKNADVKIGGIYRAKVTDKVVSVQIDAENPRGGWDATNLATTKKIRIKSAQRLRGPAPKGKTKDSAKSTAKSAPRAPRAASATQEATPPRKRHTGEHGADTAKPLSILDAAARVLAEREASDGPLNCTQMIERMRDRGYWSPRRGGKTPANTLYSAILREINTKGEESRFDKVERGRFSLTLKS